uniref:histone-lysine N-methyltransferase, H3 lysine-9 specific SUVH5-like n=1 Tax=Erigeron canadensis TaxID=72917 RepID=UPI001CB95100|nr:histone-lysine N-methyltransferase, H3 lysine-9 specific SUVH5-like [Erigeron canadensis]
MEVSENDDVKLNRNKICKQVGSNDKRFYSDSKQTSRQTKYVDPIVCSKGGFARKVKVTTSVIRKKPLGPTKHENVKRTGSQSNERSLGLNNGSGPKPRVTATVASPDKRLKVVDSNLGKDKLVDYKALEKKILERIESKESGRNRTSRGSRPAGKTKFYDPTCPEEDDHVKKAVENATVVSSQKEKAEREKFKIAMARFEQVYKELHEENMKRSTLEKVSPLQLTVDAAKKVKRELKLMDPEKKIGSICGVQVGDRFQFRSQFQMVGLHCQPYRGIDYINNGKSLAISVVDSHRYSNVSGYSDKLIYSGHGGGNGIGLYGPKTTPEDQELKQGNLALKNSMDEKSLVRVIRKVKVAERDEFVYDGLYMVKDYKEVISEEGTLVFKFELNRVPGQPSLHEMFNGNWQLH